MASKQTLRRELLKQLGLVATIPALVTSLFLLWGLYPQLSKNIYEEQQSIAQLVALETRERIIASEEQVQLLLEMARLSGKDYLRSLMARFTEKNNYFDTLYILDEFGSIEYITIRGFTEFSGNELYQGIDMSKSSLFVEHDHQLESTWSSVFLSVVTGRPSIAYMVHAGTQYLVAELAIDRLPKLSEELMQHDILLVLFDQHSQIIAHPSSGVSQQLVNMSRLPLLREAVAKGKEIIFGEFNMDQQTFVGTIVSVENPPWHILVAENKDNLLAPLYNALQTWLIAMLVIFVISLMIAERRARNLIERIDILNDHARDITRGYYDRTYDKQDIVEFKELSGNLIKMAKAIADRERELKMQEQQLRNTLESAPNIAIQWYDENGTVYYWNPASEHIFGIGQHEASEVNINLLMFPPAAAADFVKILKRVAQKHVSSEEFELPFTHKSGDKGFVHGTVFSVPSEQGKDLCVCMMTDVTKQRQAEASILKLNQDLESRVEERTQELKHSNQELEETIATLNRTMNQLVHSEKLAALGSLVAGVSHELNTPIGNALMASSSLRDFTLEIQTQLQQGNMKKSSLERFLEDTIAASGITERNLERASELITSFKQVATDQSSSQRREFSLQHLTEEILLTLHPQTKKVPVEIETEIPEGIVLDSYPGPLGQILNNLVLNAIVHAFPDEQPGTIRISGTNFGGMVSIFVRDDGVGIEKSAIKRLFDPFYTTRLGQGGSGLGLHIVHNLATEVLGGSIKVSSLPGEGTSFTLTIPESAPVGPVQSNESQESG